MSTTIRGVIFDFNGTLCQDSSLHIELFRSYYRMHGKDDSQDNEFFVRNIFGKTNEQIYREQFNPNATEEEIAAFDEMKERLYREECIALGDDFCLAAGAEELLDYLKSRSIPCCLATGSPLSNLEFYERTLALDRWFTIGDNVLYTDGSFPGKPDPAIYRLAADRIGLSPEDCLVFEDATSGVVSAKRAGVRHVVAVVEKGFPEPTVIDGARADSIHHDFTDWRTILAQYGLYSFHEK